MKKDIVWLADTREILKKFPKKVRDDIGFGLFCEEVKLPNDKIKPLTGFKHAVREITSQYQGDAYRAAYVVNLGEKIYVLHVFQKKSNQGIKTPRPDLELIKNRLRGLEQEIRESKK